jgi:hypothetical protein
MARVISGVALLLLGFTVEQVSATDHAYATMKGKRLLVLGNFFLGDNDAGIKMHWESVDGQLCEFAARQGVKVDYMLSSTNHIPASVAFKLCYGNSVICKERTALECYDNWMASLDEADPSRHHDAVTSRDDLTIEGTQLLAERLGLPTLFKPGTSLASFALNLALAFNNTPAYQLGHSCATPSVEEVPDSAFPLYVKYALGLHSSGGWGGECVRQMATARNRSELALKLPFFCGKGMHSYAFLQEQDQREMFLTKALFGTEVSVEVAVYHGQVVFASFRAAHMTCGGKVTSTWPASAPGWEAAKPQCRALVDSVVASGGVWNSLVGVQLFYDWRTDSPTYGCRLVEMNPRPHDWAMLADHSWSLRHGGADYFDYGAVGEWRLWRCR